MSNDPRLTSKEFADGMDRRRGMRVLSVSVARVSGLDPQQVLATLVLVEQRAKHEGADELVKAVSAELADHRADVRAETLARMAKVAHLADGIPA